MKIASLTYVRFCRIADSGLGFEEGDIVVFESTVYPGVTEDVCGPLLSKVSGLTAGSDFNLGYSPERINPGDNKHTFKTITKVVSGDTNDSLETIASVYEAVVEAGVYRASSIKVAEAAKVIENTQRDVNIALMNELAIIFERMDIQTSEVLAAARTKWNFLRSAPVWLAGTVSGWTPTTSPRRRSHWGTTRRLSCPVEGSMTGWAHSLPRNLSRCLWLQSGH